MSRSQHCHDLLTSFDLPYKVADLEGNSFKCEVAITKRGSEVGHSFFPCSPAFFGKANLPQLIENGGAIVRGALRPPPPDDESGCKQFPNNDESLFEQDNTCDIEDSPQIQMARRGGCNFMRKAENHHHSADGIIVINSNPHELFVMAGERPQQMFKYGCSKDDYLPVSVLVSGHDGDAIIQLLHDEGNDFEATILLTKDSDGFITFPYVKGTADALSILASNGWGVHALPQQAAQNEQQGWQLFITQHDKQ